MPNRAVSAAFAVLLAIPPAFAAVPPGVTRQLPPGYDVLGSASMRVGAPARSVVIVALGRGGERDTQRGEVRVPARPLLIFAQRPGGAFTRIGRNDTVVNRADEGGQCDPFLDGGGVIAARGPFFTVQNGVACGAQHWTDYITFRFNGGRGFVFDNERSESWKLAPSREPDAEAMVRDGPPRMRRGAAGHAVGFNAWRPER